jgi:hypothetical protein
VQLGAETTPGTAVPATKLLENLTVAMTPNPDVKTYRGTGRRWASSSALNREWTDVKLSGDLDYQDFIYLASGAWGAPTPATHTGGTLSKDWIWTPPVSGSITPKTYTVEQGDATRAHRVAYGVIQGFGYKGSRKDGFTVTGDMLAQAFVDAVTMTATPTAVALAPCPGANVNIYIDPTSAALGTTQFLRAFTFEYEYSSGFDGFWPLNRANVSYAGHVDTTPKNTCKFLLEADAAGMGVYTHLRAGDTVYVRFDAVGPIIELAITYAIQHDMAIKLLSVSEFKDEGGIFAIEYTGEIIEDAAWASGQSQKLTVTNKLTAL